MIEIYTDGACNPISDQGGWAAVVVENDQKQSHSGTVGKTTSNRMEITAAIEGISRTPPDAEMTLYTDSQYLFGSMTKGWQRKANVDLWQRLDSAASKRKVYWQWVDQNLNHPFHQEAHNLATALASGKGAQSPVTEVPPAAPAAELTHIDASGRPRMVDVSQKADTEREAIAKGAVRMQPATFKRIKGGDIAKGDVLTTAQLAGIMAAKQTSHLIPLCHPVLLGEVRVEFNLDEENSTVEITASARSTGKTGVEMEALTAVAVAALTIYDMCKAVDRGMRIEGIRLVRKSGGKSGLIQLE
ncbi:MAG: cyclic pyranopterin monophosphate synthase MoaC [Dehalococcoidales bacterium]|nr:cyclic pyranopterin monophosphate synthase MoaC [Dehalococcoidales bacterium]